MKKLQKMLLTNWHYFSHEVIEFSQINFLTGENGTGKTTLLDALQLIILGDTAGNFFNKSASEKSSRSLKGYLRCEIGDNSDGTSLYLRNGRFSSYVVCEFYDDLANKPFTLGICFDIFETGEIDKHFFYFNGAIPQNEFIENNIPLCFKQLSPYLMANYDDVKIFPSNIEYREFIKVKFGNVTNGFFSLFKKAIPFTPINDIEKFITEYVCDVDNNIDVAKMQENFRNYKRLEIETKDLEKRVEILKDLVERYNKWKEETSSIQVKKYIMDRSDLYLANHEEEKVKLKIDDLKADIAENQQILKKTLEMIEEANKNKEKMMEEKFQSDVYKRKAVYQDRYDQATEKINAINSSINDIKNSLLSYVSDWSNAISELFNNFPESFKDEEEGKQASEILTVLENMQNQVLSNNVNDSLLQKTSYEVLNFQETIRNKQYALLSDSAKKSEEIKTIDEEIRQTSEGKKPYDYRLVQFKEAICDGLRQKHGQDIEVNFLSDLVDIKDEEWRTAIETYLNTQRFYLVVDAKYVADSYKIFDSIKKDLPYFDYGIIDTEKVVLNAKDPLENSVAEEIISTNIAAKAFCNMLLGAIIKVDSIDNIRNYPRSLTSDGMLYQNYVVRSLNTRNTISYMGSKATNQYKLAKESERNELVRELGKINFNIESLRTLVNLQFINTNEINSISKAYEGTSELNALLLEQKTNKDMLDSISDNFLKSLEKQIQEIDMSIQELQADKDNINQTITRANVMIENLLDRDLPEAQLKVTQLTAKISNEYDKQFIAESGEVEFLNLLKEDKDPLSLFNQYKIEIESTLNGLNNQWRAICDHRTKYNTIYELNYDAHSNSNEDYQKEYSELGEIKLVEYNAKIKEAKENAMKEFRNDFLAKLKENFDIVIGQIDALNSALEYAKFGLDSYKFSVDPRLEYKEYYQMINDPLLLTGSAIEDEEFSKKYSNSIENLFRQITFTDSADANSELEHNVVKFTDYRSYLKFDLIVTNSNGYTQRLSKTLNSKSGGETQTPFYISILASFAQAYRLYLGNEKNSSIRLIIFDEAFSKMDAVRVEESIKLLRNFGLQAIVSAPTDKAKTISPLVDRTICTVRDNTQATTRPFFETK